MKPDNSKDSPGPKHGIPDWLRTENRDQLPKGKNDGQQNPK